MLLNDKLLPSFAKKLMSRITNTQNKRRILRTPFYKKNPFTSPLSIFEIDRRAFISSELGVLYSGIGKSAHSSVLLNMGRMLHGENASADEAKEQMFLKPSDLSIEQVELVEDLFTFTFVRNPYSRTLSAFLDKVVRGKIIPKKLALACGGAEPTYLDFCRYLEQGGLYEGVHWAPQSEVLVLPFESLDFVGRVENFEQDFCSVVEAAKFSQVLFESASHVPHRTGASDNIKKHYTEQTKNIIKRLFEKDFDLFDYSTDLIF